MFTLTDTQGKMREVEGIDIDVWDANVLGNGEKKGIVVTGYPMYRDADGLWDTNTSITLFSAETNLNPEDHDESAWYGLSDDTVPGDIPGDVLDIVTNILKEISL